MTKNYFFYSIIFLIFGLFFVRSENVLATVRYGYVKTPTNAPVVGVWLKVHYEWLTDNYIYIQTDVNGLYAVDTNDSGSGTADIDLNPDTPPVPRRNGCPFCHVSGGNYGMNFIWPYSWGGTVTVPTWTGYFSLGSSGTAEYPVVVTRTPSISGWVFVDSNNNGIKDTGETGYNSNNGIVLGVSSLQPALSAISSSTGNYMIRGKQIYVGGGASGFPSLLTPGNHTLTFNVPFGYQIDYQNGISCTPSSGCNTASCSSASCLQGSVVTIPVSLEQDLVANFAIRLMPSATPTPTPTPMPTNRPWLKTSGGDVHSNK